MKDRTIFIILVITYTFVSYILNTRFKKSVSDATVQNVFNDELYMKILFVSIILLVLIKKLFHNYYWIAVIPIIIILVYMIANLISVFNKVSIEKISRKIFNSYLFVQLFRGICIALIMLYVVMNF